MAKTEKQRLKRNLHGAKMGAANRGNRMGLGALRPGTAIKHSSSSAKPGRTGPKGETRVNGTSHLRSEATIKRLKMYKSKPNIHKMKEQSTKPVRIQPDRRWFGNTRVIAQSKMQAFRATLAKKVDDPYSIVLKSSKLPMSLLRDTEGKASRMNLLSVEPFKDVFGKRRRQKRVKLGSYDLEGLMQTVSEKTQEYDGEEDTRSLVDPSSGIAKAKEDSLGDRPEEIFNKGTSKRIWAELYKVVDASDVLVFILDARDPMGTRNLHLEREVRKNRPGKHIVLLLNKVDLVPTWAARRWVQILTLEFPTIAFHASIQNPFGKNAFLNLLRQFGTLIKERKHLTIGMLGYPNVGKSSVINTMRRKKVCKAAPVPGETRVWQYIALTKKLYLLDCPGVVPPTANDFREDCNKVLRGVVRAERIENPSDYIGEVLSRVKRPYLLLKYKLPPETTWSGPEEFLTILGRKMGKLLKGGDADINIAARIVLYDWQRGRIPFFVAPPDEREGEQGVKESSGKTSAAAPSGAQQDSGGGATDNNDSAVPPMPPPASASASEESRPSTPATVAASSSSSSSSSTAPAAVAGPVTDVTDAAAKQGNNAAAPTMAGPEAAANTPTRKIEETDEEEEPHATLLPPAVRQSLAELTCAFAFDEEDRRGDAVPVEAPKKQPADAENRRNFKKRPRGTDDHDSAPAAPGAAAPEASRMLAKKKARKKRRGGAMAAVASGKTVGGGAAAVAAELRQGRPLVERGSVDWQAVVSEFGT